MAGLNDIFRRVRQVMEQEFKGHFRIFEPRRIPGQPQYTSTKLIPPMLHCALEQAREAIQGGCPPLATSGLSVTLQILNHAVPVYFVAEQFARAVAATELPGDFTIKDLRWPMPGMVLGFPEKFMAEYCGEGISYVFCADLKAGDYNPPPFFMGVVPGTSVPVSKAGMMFFGWDKALKSPQEFVGVYQEQDKMSEVATKYTYLDYTESSPEKAKTDEERLNQIVNLVLKLLVVLNTRGDLVTEAVCTRQGRGAQRGDPSYELWSPNYIGDKYRVQRIKGDGAHASPGLHWRRGHLTWQVVGKREDLVPISTLPRLTDGSPDASQIDPQTMEKFRLSHKRLWLEPVLVGI